MNTWKHDRCKNGTGTARLCRGPKKGTGTSRLRRSEPVPFFGFTLVELLVVIVIIGILVSLLVPAVGAVRKVARNTATSAAITSIGTGLETFKADAKLGGLYPPSYSDADPTVVGSTLQRGWVYSPYGNPPNPVSFPISGAGLLVWALTGADLLGTAGFPSFGNPALWSEWSNNTLNTTDQTLSGAYALDGNGQPVHVRYGPYVDSSKLQVTRFESGGFTVPAEFNARNALQLQPISRQYPLFLDAFGYPIVYWRADPAGRKMANIDRSRTDLPRGVYWSEDNSDLTDTGSPNVLVLNKARARHALDWDDNESIPPLLGTFQGYILDKAVQAKAAVGGWPQRADSYLLVSPGADGCYGTADDVTNFQPNGK